MKRLQLLVFALLLAGTLSAQQVTVKKEIDGNTVKITKIVPDWVKKHDFRLGAGTYSFSTEVFFRNFRIPGTMIDYDISPIKDFNDRVYFGDIYRTTSYFTGTYSLSYAYHLRRWFQVGGTVSYAGVICSRRDCVTKEVVVNENEHMFSVMPTLRFIYLYRDNFQLYSSLSLGMVFSDYETIPFGDVTILGCTFGRKIFGFAEFGAGLGGWGRVGIGYRFDAKKRSKK